MLEAREIALFLGDTDPSDEELIDVKERGEGQSTSSTSPRTAESLNGHSAGQSIVNVDSSMRRSGRQRLPSRDYDISTSRKRSKR